MYRGSYIKIKDFSGGYAGNLPASALETKEAADADNIVIGVGGRYFRSRYGTTKTHVTEIGTASDTFAVKGLGVLQISATGTGHMLAIKKNKAYGALTANTGMTFTDRTGAVTISNNVNAGADLLGYRWSLFQHNDLLIGFGGSIANPDAPFKWAGETNNIAALGGSPPSAAFGFSANNRSFGCRTAANPAILQWSILGNPEDWTGTGSGSATIGTLNDAGPITDYAVLPQNILLVFKASSTYQISLVSAPFPQYVLFRDIGAIPGSAVMVDGKVYFISQRLIPMVTDGDSVQPLGMGANALWRTTQASYATYSVYGFRIRGRDHDWVCWTQLAPNSNLGISALTLAWDINNKCWLKFTTGMNFSSSATDSTGTFWGGYYNQGFVFQHENAWNSSTEDTGENSGNINSYWRSGIMTQGTADQITQINKLLIGQYVGSSLHNAQALNVSYGFNFIPDQKSTTLAQTATSTETENARTITLSGNGNGFQFKIGQNTSSNDYWINRIWVGGKASGQKALVP